MSTRANTLDELGTRTFDALIVGGGITGAGIARDAAMRGIAVALVDKGDFASGTSSRSSRLIHGGVRYLEHGHLHLVFEASAERRRLLRTAPKLVHPLPFTWPLYLGQRLSLWKLSAGLTLYDMLALFRNVGRHQRLDARGVLRHEPRLKHAGLRGGVRYFDARTDDARLTLANVLDAQTLGAIVANHAAVVQIENRNGLRCCTLEDALTGNRFEVRARLLVNATGPWSDTFRQIETGASAKRVQGSKGAHIAVSHERVGNRDAITLLHPRDARVMFALPAGRHTIIGTTDTFTDADPDEVRADERDVAYLLEAANEFFPTAALSRNDVVSAWAGIRPLLPTTKSAGAATREHAIAHADRTITVTGGKLTTYRVMARQVVDVLQKALRMPRNTAATNRRPLPGLERPAEGNLIASDLSYRMSEMRWAVDRELACTLGDLLIRRTHVAFETRDQGRAAARDVAAFLGWGASELERYESEVRRIFTIDQ